MITKSMCGETVMKINHFPFPDTQAPCGKCHMQLLGEEKKPVCIYLYSVCDKECVNLKYEYNFHPLCFLQECFKVSFVKASPFPPPPTKRLPLEIWAEVSKRCIVRTPSQARLIEVHGLIRFL